MPRSSDLKPRMRALAARSALTRGLVWGRLAAGAWPWHGTADTAILVHGHEAADTGLRSPSVPRRPRRAHPSCGERGGGATGPSADRSPALYGPDASRAGLRRHP